MIGCRDRRHCRRGNLRKRCLSMIRFDKRIITMYEFAKKMLNKHKDALQQPFDTLDDKVEITFTGGSDVKDKMEYSIEHD